MWGVNLSIINVGIRKAQADKPSPIMRKAQKATASWAATALGLYTAYS